MRKFLLLSVPFAAVFALACGRDRDANVPQTETTTTGAPTAVTPATTMPPPAYPSPAETAPSWTAPSPSPSPTMTTPSPSPTMPSPNMYGDAGAAPRMDDGTMHDMNQPDRMRK